MPGGGEQKQEEVSTTAPWAPTQPMLMDMLKKYGGMNTDVTGGQSGALTRMAADAANVPQYGGEAQTLANTLFAGGGAGANAGMLTDAYGDLRKSLAPMLDPNFTNPYSNPALTAALDTMRGDITNQVRGSFAKSGRTGSPAESMALGRGIAAGQAPILVDQYNKLLSAQMGAAGTQFGAGGSTATGLDAMTQQGVANKIQGLGVAGAIPGIMAAPGQAQFDVANMAYGLPYQNVGMLSKSLLPFAALGGETKGTKTAETETNMGPTIAGGALGAASIAAMIF
jgi:hypothetical protein